MTIEENVTLAPYTTFRLGGMARYFCTVTSIGKVEEAVSFAKKLNLPVFYLGGGSNIVVADEGFPGLVIKIEMLGMEYRENKTKKDASSKRSEGINEDSVELSVGAGEVWDDVVAETVSRGFYGLENLSAIPGTVGAAPIQNIGAYGREVSEIISRVEAFNTETQKIESFSKEKCAFTYRSSFFKTLAGKKYIVTRVFFNLKRHAELNTSAYRDIEVYFKEHSNIPVALQSFREAILSIRHNKLPDWRTIGTAGSFFKNPIVTKERCEELKALYPGLPVYPLDDAHVKIALGYVIDVVCGLRGIRHGAFGTYQKQALALVHYGGGTTHELQEFINEISHAVFDKINITPEPEVVFVA